VRRVHLIGHSGHGKTTLAVALIAHWTVAGLCVGSIKHTGHVHELDAPGKDSWRHRQAGAHPAAIIAGDRLALHLPLHVADNPYALLTAHYAGCDLVLVEGDVGTTAPQIEVWRDGLGVPPLAATRAGIRAIITDDRTGLPLAHWPRQDVPRLAAQILELAGA